MSKSKKSDWHFLKPEEIAKKLKTDLKKGLSYEDIIKFQNKYGKNSFEKKGDFGILGKIFVQFKNPLILILFVAGLATLFLGEYTDSFVIFLALIVNTGIGTFQENKASKAFEKLNESQQKFTTVIREGRKNVVPVSELVPGDLVIIEAGAYVPADIRLIEEKNMLVNEAVLTGEWVGVPKSVVTENKKIKKEGLQSNMIWMGTLISGGYGRGIVVATGDKTQIGQIATSLANVEEEKTPIKENIEKLARFLTVLVVASLILIFILGVFRGESITSMVLISIAVAVAVMPEGLPAAVTSVLAVGMSAILKKGGLVRNLLAAETLGSTTVILTDKTGTITEAKMHLSDFFSANSVKNKDITIQNPANQDLLRMAVLSSDAFVEDRDEAPDKLTVRGRPLEKAMVVAGLEVGIAQRDLSKENQRVDLMGFESKNGFSASLNENGKEKNKRLYVSGIPELILENSISIYENGKEKRFSKELRKEFKKIQKQKSAEGMRFTALAYRDVNWEKIPEAEKKDAKNKIANKLVFVGFLAFEDPIRKDAKKSIQKAQKAGARVIMVTGDNPNTAGNIAQEVGIIKKGDRVLIGADVELMKDKELSKELKVVKVFARMAPAQKLRLSKLLQKNDEVVAMTGDGINDAPALQGADIGIAMNNGTEVAKEASDLILMKGSFSVITYAIEEGRKIIDNLKKIVGYLLSTSFSEVFLIGGSLLIGLPLPILPAQILWSNMIEEGLMNFAFVFEPGEKDLMERDPRSQRTRNILTGPLKQMILIVSFVTGVFLLALFWFLNQFNLSIEEIRTIMFVALSIDSIFFAFSFKALDKPIWKEDIFSNRYLIISWITSMVLLLVAMFFPPIQKMLSLTTLTGIELLFLIVIGIFNLVIIEVTKYFVFAYQKVNNLK